MTLQYVGSGGIRFRGCAYASFTPTYLWPYGVGDRLFIRRLAVKGHLEFVYIKRVDMPHHLAFDSGMIEAVYVDTFNWRHREGDLCTEIEALELAIAFYENYITSITNLIGCYPIFET